VDQAADWRTGALTALAGMAGWRMACSLHGHCPTKDRQRRRRQWPAIKAIIRQGIQIGLYL
jgi:hypothetical protein